MAQTHLFSGNQFYSSVDVTYLDSGNADDNFIGQDWDLISTASITRVGVMTFRIPEKVYVKLKLLEERVLIKHILILLI